MIFFYVYVIASEINGDLYVGHTKKLKDRLAAHNSGKNVSTKNMKPWKLIYLEGYINKQDALGREKFLISGSGERYIYKQLSNYLSAA